METVAIAVLCSIHLIRSRNKHLDHEHALQEELTALKHSVRSARRVLPDLEGGGPPDRRRRARVDGVEHPPPPPYSLAPAKARRRWREDFYDHFLDGAAGVMYTSFLGLILDDLIALGTGKYKNVDVCIVLFSNIRSAECLSRRLVCLSTPSSRASISTR